MSFDEMMNVIAFVIAVFCLLWALALFGVFLYCRLRDEYNMKRADRMFKEMKKRSSIPLSLDEQDELIKQLEKEGF